MGRLLTFGFTLICCYAWAIEIYDKAVDVEIPPLPKYAGIDVVGFLERLKDMLRTGNSTLGLPPLDPLCSEELPFELDTVEFKFDGLLTNVDVQGLAGYDVNDGSFNIIGIKLSMNITWPVVNGVTDYTMDGKISDVIHIYGTGKINLKAEGFNFAADLSFTTRDGHLVVNTLKTEFSLQRLEFEATGLLDDEKSSEILSAVISEMVPDLIREYQKDLQDFINPAISNLLNGFLANKSLSDIINIIGGS